MHQLLSHIDFGGLKLAFEEVLNLGDGTFTGQRIAVALLKAQELGLELPPVIANFSSCQLRLSNAVNSLNNTMKELNSIIVMLGNKKVTYDMRQTNTDPIVMAKKIWQLILPKKVSRIA